MALLEETKESLQRMHDFDTASLPRTDDLGKSLDFRDAVEPADELIGLYKRLPPAVLEDFPDTQLTQIKNQSDADYNRLKQILDFETSASNPQNVRTSLIGELKTAYSTSFPILMPFIAYGVSKATDFQRMENEARAMMQSIEDQANKLKDDLENKKKSAESILEDIRNTAAEQGVSQQAITYNIFRTF